MILSFFWLLLAYSLIGPFLLRITLGLALVVLSYKKIRSSGTSNEKAFYIIQGIIGILFIIGLFVQVIALIACIIFLIQLMHKAWKRSLFTDGVNYYFLLFMISLSLLFLGPGFFALDLPL